MKNAYVVLMAIPVFILGCRTTGFGKIDVLASQGQKAKTGTQTENFAVNDDLSLDTLDESIVRNCKEGGGSDAVIASSRDFINNGKTVTGSCWDYLNAVYNAAGFPEAKRIKIFNGKTEGPYCDPSLVKSGDWVMFNNLGYQGVGHSGLFIQWIDYESRTALIVDHPGLNKTSSGRYRIYDITELFGVVRAAD
jgi:hypothetical protein